MSEKNRGSCLCGAVKYACGTFDEQMAHCHCSMCRKFHGAAYATFASLPRDQFRWTQGEQHLKRYEAPNGTVRTFCEQCGSSLTFVSPRADPNLVELALGTLDNEPEGRPDAHIFVKSGANWSEICDDLPRYTAGRDSERDDQD